MSNYKSWPQVNISHLSYDQPGSRSEVIRWLNNTTSEYFTETSNSFRYFTLYIKDPKLMTVFRIKYGNLIDQSKY